MTVWCTCPLTAPCECGDAAPLQESSIIRGGWTPIDDPDRAKRS